MEELSEEQKMKEGYKAEISKLLPPDRSCVNCYFYKEKMKDIDRVKGFGAICEKNDAPSPPPTSPFWDNLWLISPVFVLFALAGLLTWLIICIVR